MLCVHNSNCNNSDEHSLSVCLKLKQLMMSDNESDRE